MGRESYKLLIAHNIFTIIYKGAKRDKERNRDGQRQNENKKEFKLQ